MESPVVINIHSDEGDMKFLAEFMIAPVELGFVSLKTLGVSFTPGVLVISTISSGVRAPSFQ